jgi:hypothetical protein
MSAPSPDAELIRTAASRSEFETFKPILSDRVAIPEAQAVLEDIGAWYDANPGAATISWSAFLGWARIARRSVWKPDKWSVYVEIVNTAAALPAANPAIVARFHEFKTLGLLRSEVENQIRASKPDGLAEIVRIAEEGITALGAAATKGDSELVTDDLGALLDVVTRVHGLEWRLEDMNLSIGPIDKGDVVLIGKRPEVGGTTFLASEFAYMAPQLPKGKHAVIFTNEEVGAKVKMRIISAALGRSQADIAADPKKAEADLARILDGRRIDVIHNTAMTNRTVERRLRSGMYGLIGINVLDKVRMVGNKAEGADLKRDIGIWTRQLADTYGAVMGVLQADASAEGEKWPDQSRLYGSKTGLQAESDVLIMIGKTHNPAEADRRYMGVVRNKLPGGSRTKPGYRHGQFEVRFDSETARFSSLVAKRPGGGR